MKLNLLNHKYRMVALQLLGWGVILATTLFWGRWSDSETLDKFAYTRLSFDIIVLLLIYIVNYTIFIPRFLFKDNHKLFFTYNFLVVCVLLFVSFYTTEYGVFDSLRPDDVPARPKPMMMYLTRDFINYILMVGLVTALRLAERLQRSEEALKEAESARVKAELDNLRSQINPHFLLNTLNNIYALTAIDTDKAQKAIKELSDLLRYILYDNLNERVSLSGEVKFLQSYIELMTIRLPRKVELKTEFRYNKEEGTLIAPLIFISLIENGFKHSVSANGEGFIDILFEHRPQSSEVVLSIRNSNHAKADADKSGHGIGLEQVRRRLELLYPNNYTWEVKQDNEVYESTITLKSNR